MSGRPRARAPVRLWPLAAFLLLALFTSRCAPRALRSYAPAGPEEVLKATASWEEALARADSLGPSRLLYDARVIQGLLHVPGTLSVMQAPGRLDATLAGPFGNPLARYADGALAGEGLRPFRAEPEDLRSLLAGVWRKGTPRVIGIRGEETLLEWDGPEGAEAILDVPRSRLRSLKITRGEGALAASYSGEFAPWPHRVELEDVRSGNKLRLTMIGHERLGE